MKCLKNKKTEEIIRVDDLQANQMVGITWKYVSKSEWKSATRTTPTVQQVVETEKKEKTLSKKAARRAIFKSND